MRYKLIFIIDEIGEQIEKYKAAVELIKYYNDNLRRSISDFILAHTILFAFILTKVFDKDARPSISFLIVALFGFFLCVVWYGSATRFRAHRDLRFAQARAAEPEGWDLITGTGKDFSDGKQVRIGGKIFKMDWLSREIDRRDVKLLTWGFAFIYLLIIWKNIPAVF
ncbi:MAG: hypothetical protein WCX69_05815 [Candidatus Paceibacterota bacterium]